MKLNTFDNSNRSNNKGEIKQHDDSGFVYDVHTGLLNEVYADPRYDPAATGAD